MISSNLSGRELNAWSGVSFDCSCGKRHELNTAFYIGEGAENDIVSAVSALAPSCCGVMLLRGEGYDVSDLSQLCAAEDIRFASAKLPTTPTSSFWRT